MRILLDTNLVLWAMSGDSKLSRLAQKEIDQADIVYVSAASVWEIAIKSSLGRLDIDLDELLPKLDEAGFAELPLSWSHTRAVRDLPGHHRDPFDRLLVAQALSEPLRLLTHDRLLERYGSVVSIV